MPLTDEEAMTLVALHGAAWHYSPSTEFPGQWAVWNRETGEGERPWSELARDTLGEACRDYCRRHGLGKG